MLVLWHCHPGWHCRSEPLALLPWHCRTSGIVGSIVGGWHRRVAVASAGIVAQAALLLYFSLLCNGIVTLVALSLCRHCPLGHCQSPAVLSTERLARSAMTSGARKRRRSSSTSSSSGSSGRSPMQQDLQLDVITYSAHSANMKSEDREGLALLR